MPEPYAVEPRPETATTPQSFLCAVVLAPRPTCVPLAHRGDVLERMGLASPVHPLVSISREEYSPEPGFYVWTGTGHRLQAGRRAADVWMGTFRPATAADFAAFGFPLPRPIIEPEG